MVERAMGVLQDPQRSFVSSDLVRLEVLPKALFHHQLQEAALYEHYFSVVVENVDISTELANHAFTLAARWNLNALDALHLAAAILLDADEFVTTERPASPLVAARIDDLRIVTIS